MVMAFTAITSFAPSLFTPSLSHPTSTSVIYSPSAFVPTTFSGLNYKRPSRLRPVFSAPRPFVGTSNLEDNNDEEFKKLRAVMIDVPPVFNDRVKNIVREAEAIAKSDAINQRYYDDIIDRMVILLQDIVDYVDNRRKKKQIMDFFMHHLGIFTVFLCFILCFFSLRLGGGSGKTSLRLLGCCFCITLLMSRVSKIFSI